MAGSILLSRAAGKTARQLRATAKKASRQLHSRITSISLPRPILPSITIPSIRLPKLPQPNIPTTSYTYIITKTLTITIIIVGTSTLVYQYILKDLPHPKTLITNPPAVTTKIYDRDQNLLYKVYKNENRTLVDLSQIPTHVIQATLAIEDAQFYDHAGFSVKGISRAIYQNLTDDSLQGGSTITQQLVKNVLLTPERTYTRKLKELVLSIAVESYYSKNEILNMYFNQIGYGGPTHGIEEASQMYFNKSVTQLNLAEAALVAGLPAAPTAYSPFGTQPIRAKQRQTEVLRRMVEEGYISNETAQKARSQQLVFANPKTDITAPHFVMYTRELVAQTYGEQAVQAGGLEITTTIDKDIQELAEYAISQELENLKSLNVNNAAAIVTNPKTGEVLAMVGSKDYFDSANDGQVNVVLRPRQPGSSIKPLNYAIALESGMTAATLILDAPITYNIPGSPPYSPRNYDGRFHGYVTLRQALANSYNIPAVKTLSTYGVSKMVNIGREFGITTWNDPSRFGLALTLGGGEVTLNDMAELYGTFANQGIHVETSPLISVTNFDRSINDKYACQPKPAEQALLKQAHALDFSQECGGDRVISNATAYIISDILSDNRARSAAFGSNSILNIQGHQVAVKTGTTNNLRDNWTIGYTSEYVVGVWVGNNDNTPMSRIASGLSGASPIWHNIMTPLLRNKPPHQFQAPDTVTTATICPLTGTKSCAACPNPVTEIFATDTVPNKSCTQEIIDQIIQSRADQSQTR